MYLYKTSQTSRILIHSGQVPNEGAAPDRYCYRSLAAFVKGEERFVSRSINAKETNTMRQAIGAASLTAFLAYGVCSQSTPSSQARTPAGDMRPDVRSAEAAGWDKVVVGLLSAFDNADVVGLQATRGRQGSDLRLRLIRHPDFPNKARLIVVEWGNSLYQSILDRYLRGEGVPLTELQQVWRNQTQVASWDSSIHAEFFAAVREVNRKLPSPKQLRVLAGDPPIDWTRVQTRAEYGQ